MEQVFISYSRRDLEFVKRLSADLQAAGLKVWYDLSGLEVGTRWGFEIQNALDQSRFFIAILSPNSCRSEWVEREFLYACNHKLKILPVLYQPCDLPLWSLNLHFMELQEENYADGLGELLRILGVKQQLEKPAAEVVVPPVVTAEVIAETASSLPAARPEEEVIPQPGGKREEPAVVVPPGSREEEKKQAPDLPAGELPVLQPKIEEIPPFVQDKEQDWELPTPVLERKVEPEKAVDEKKSKKPFKVKPAPRVKEDKRTSARPGRKKLWGAGGFAALILLALGVVLFGGDIKATLFPDKPTQTITPTQPPTETFSPTIFTNTPTKTILPTPPIDSKGVRQADGMQMVYVPEGEFTMGSEEGQKNEKPAHQVYLDAYWIDQTEVSIGMYDLCVNVGVCQSSVWHIAAGRDTPYFPVNYVNWTDAKTYCEWVGGRLPTEAEWEKAARGTDGRMYPWGNEEPTCGLSNFTSGDCGYNDEYGRFVSTSDDPSCLRGDCLGYYVSVNSFPSGASSYKVLNMAGGVWEWVADWFGEYPGTLVSNPTGPSTGEDRILRGGAWTSSASDIRTTFRYASSPGSMSYTIGFRCAISAEP